MMQGSEDHVKKKTGYPVFFFKIVMKKLPLYAIVAYQRQSSCLAVVVFVFFVSLDFWTGP